MPSIKTSGPVRTIPIASLALALAAVAVHVVPHAADLLQYDRTVTATGEWWRLLTWHWAHWSTDHLFWDTAAFLALGIICERRHRARLLVCVVASALVLSCWAWFIADDPIPLRGLSGIDSALFGLAATLTLRRALRDRDRLSGAAALMAIVAFAGKVAFELVFDRTLFVNSVAIGMRPLPWSHAVGLVCGLATGVRAGQVPTVTRADPQPQSPTGASRDDALVTYRSLPE